MLEDLYTGGGYLLHMKKRVQFFPKGLRVGPRQGSRALGSVLDKVLGP
jgi:hypothetical protein